MALCSWRRRFAVAQAGQKRDPGLEMAGNLANVGLDVSRPRSIKIQFECKLVHTSPSRIGFFNIRALSIPDSVHC